MGLPPHNQPSRLPPLPELLVVRRVANGYVVEEALHGTVGSPKQQVAETSQTLLTLVATWSMNIEVEAAARRQAAVSPPRQAPGALP